MNSSRADRARRPRGSRSASASGRPKAMFSRDGAGEQERLLRHDAHLRAQRVARDVAQVVPVDQHAPARSGRRSAPRAWPSSTCRRRSRRPARRSGPGGIVRSTSLEREPPGGRSLAARARARRRRRRRRSATSPRMRPSVDRVGAVGERRAARRAAGRSSRAPPCPTGRSCTAARAAGSVRTGTTAPPRTPTTVPTVMWPSIAW